MTSTEKKPRDLGNIVGETFEVYKTNFIRLIAIVAIVEVILFAIILTAGLMVPFWDWEEWVAGEVGPLIVWLVIVLLSSFVLYSLMQGALIHAITKQYTKQPIEIVKAYIFAWR